MSHNHKDPKTYLIESVSKRGRSGPDGVYLTNLTVVAESTTDYGYKANILRAAPLTPPVSICYEEWLSLIVKLRTDSVQNPCSIFTDEAIYQFLPEGGSISLNVFIPVLDADTFEYFVCFCQDMMECVSEFTGKLALSIRFSIGYCNRTWRDLADDGEVEEQDFSF